MSEHDPIEAPETKGGSISTRTLLYIVLGGGSVLGVGSGAVGLASTSQVEALEKQAGALSEQVTELEDQVESLTTQHKLDYRDVEELQGKLVDLDSKMGDVRDNQLLICEKLGANCAR